MKAPFPSPTKTWHDTTYPSVSPTRPELSATGKTIVITGGGTGIGAETALYFARAGAARIALLGRRLQPLLDTKVSIEKEVPGVEIFAQSADVTKQQEMDAAFDAFISGKNGGKIDVMVAGAAVTGPMESANEVDPEAFLKTIDTNLRGSIYTAKAFLRYAAQDAVVIDINSSAAHVNFAALFATYNAAKLAVYRLWDCLAVANPEMRVYHIQPGVVDTAMNREVGGVEAMGFADDVSLPASFNVWLASPEAAFLKNKFLWANWDVEELKAEAKEIEGSTRLNIALGGWPFGEDINWTAGWGKE